MPYPNTDPDMISGRLMNEPVQITRNKLIYYQGGNHGSCVDIRNALNELMRNKKIAPQAGPKKREMGICSIVLFSNRLRIFYLFSFLIGRISTSGVLPDSSRRFSLQQATSRNTKLICD